MTRWHTCQLSIEIGCNSQLDQLPKQYPYYLRYLPNTDPNQYLAVLRVLRDSNYQVTAHVPARRFTDIQAVSTFLKHCTQMGVYRFLLIAGDDKYPKGCLAGTADLIMLMKKSKLNWGSVISPLRSDQTQSHWLENQHKKSNGASFLISQLWYESQQWQQYWTTQLPWGQCVSPPLSYSKFSCLQKKSIHKELHIIQQKPTQGARCIQRSLGCT